jgi:hypothetical protein
MNIRDSLEFALEHLPFPWGWPVAVGIVLIAALSYLVRYRWNYHGERGLKLAFSRPVLILFFTSVIVQSGFTFWYVNYFGIPGAFAEDQIGILVAQIPSDKNSTHQQTYAQAIREIVKESPELSSHVSVRMLDRPLSSDPDKQQEQALALGRRLHATFVLRAIPVEGAEQVWLTVVKELDFPKTEAYSSKISAAQLPNLDRLELPRDVVLLARCALAMLQYDSGNYDSTIALLSDVLRSESLPDGAPSRPYLRFYLANSYANERIFSQAIQQYDLVLSEWTETMHRCFGLVRWRTEQ